MLPGGRALVVVLCFTVAGFGFEKQISVADCQFAANPSHFLSQAARIRREVSDRTVKLNRIAERAARPLVAAEKVPQRNFIDQEIFGKLAKAGVPSAPPSS